MFVVGACTVNASKENSMKVYANMHVMLQVRGNPGTPEGVGVAAGDGVIKERLNDGSNQTGGYK